MIGATAATIVDMSDPIAALTSVMPDAMGITFALAIVAGAIMNVVLTLYTASLGLQATGARVSRVQAVLVIGAITVALSVYVLFFSIGFLDALQFAMTLLASIATPLVAIYLTDAIPRKGRYNGEALSNTEMGGPVWYSGNPILRRHRAGRRSDPRHPLIEHDNLRRSDRELVWRSGPVDTAWGDLRCHSVPAVAHSRKHGEVPPLSRDHSGG